jgi:prepilin-type N-terminal cleavage/methylation domain-containing protein
MSRRAFTLVELLVVISIIGLLSSIAVVSMSTSREKARIASGQSFESTIRNSINDTLIGEWLFDSAAVSGKTKDTSGYGNDGTISGVTAATGYNGNLAYNFSGTARIALGTALFPSDSATTITFWVNFSSLNPTGYVDFFRRGSAGDHFWVQKSNGGNKLLLQNAGGCAFDMKGDDFAIERWMFVALTMGSNGCALYEDGALKYKASSASYVDASTATSYIGGDAASGNVFILDDVRLYSSSLLAKEIGNMFIAGIPAHENK